MQSDGVPDGAALGDGLPARAGATASVAVPGRAARLTSRRGSLRLARTFLRGAYAVGGLMLFIFALELLKKGAGGLQPVLSTVSADGVLNLLGFGWTGSQAVMSGSPVAAIALSLFAGGTISDIEAFAMINGTRLGASFIVLMVGFVLYVARLRTADSLYIGVVSLLVAFTIWLPVLPIGILTLRSGWFDAAQVSTPGGVTSIIDVVYAPVVDFAVEHLHRLLVFGLGVGALLGAFAVFDRALPNLESAPGGRVERISRFLHHPLPMFALGLLITAMTLSVSISLTLLIPLSLKGYVRRDGIIPYVMGANISTWVDTLMAGLLLNSPRAFTIVLTEMVVGAGVSLFVLLFLYRPYSRVVLGVARRVTHRRRDFALFLGAIFLVPLILFFV